MLLELTDVYDDTILINPDHIVTVRLDDEVECTTITMISGLVIQVLESPTEVNMHYKELLEAGD